MNGVVYMPGTKYHKVQKNVNLQYAQQDHSWPGLPEVFKFQSARLTLCLINIWELEN